MDASSHAFELVGLGLLLVFSALLSGSETALLGASRARLRQLRDEGSRGARVALSLLEQPARLQSTLQIGVTVVNLAAAVLATSTLVRLFGASPAAALYAFAAVTVLVLLFAEILPKAFAAHHADALAPVVAPAVRWVSALVAPLARMLSFVTNLFARALGVRVLPDAPLVTEEGIQSIVRMGEEQGVLEQEAREMIHSIFEFGDTVVREVMVPRVDIVAVEADEPVEAVLEIVRRHGHSRIPVYDGNVDQIVGLIHVKDLLSGFREGRLSGRARDFARPAYFVPETKRLDELFREMRRKKVHMAVAVDEYGGTAGLVTIEDLLEEIVGPIQDEYDVEEPPIKVLNDRVALVDGLVHLEDVNAALGIALPAGDVDTVGGFVTSLLGHVPAQGERVAYDGVELAVERVDGHRIVQVRVTKSEPAPVADP